MPAPRLSPAAFRRLALANVVVLVAVVVTGATVRLTGSGLGCADWPNCSATKLVDVSSRHSAIEQVNRIFSGLIAVPLVATVVAASRLRPRRPDLVRPAWALFGLFMAEAVLGGVSVLVKLAWVSVMGHFLLAITLIGLALLLVRRAREAPGPRVAVVSRGVEILGAAVYALTIVVLVLGTLVTSAGPHGGDEEAERLAWPLGDAARVHAIAVDVLVVLVVALVVTLLRTRAPRPVVTAALLTLAAMTAQGILGYVQYAQEIPALLVGFHVFGAVLVFVAVQQLLFGMRAPAQVDVPRTPHHAPPVAVAP
jgi:cytochrome c oxidase assembly protein subunit 15